MPGHSNSVARGWINAFPSVPIRLPLSRKTTRTSTNILPIYYLLYFIFRWRSAEFRFRWRSAEVLFFANFFANPSLASDLIGDPGPEQPQG